MTEPTYFAYEPLLQTLETRGWDVTITDEIIGRRDDRLGVWTIAIDHGGRVRFTATRATSMPQGCRLQRKHQRYRLLLETQSVLTVTTKLKSAHDLPQLLDQFARFAVGRDP